MAGFLNTTLTQGVDLAGVAVEVRKINTKVACRSYALPSTKEIG